VVEQDGTRKRGIPKDLGVLNCAVGFRHGVNSFIAGGVAAHLRFPQIAGLAKV